MNPLQRIRDEKGWDRRGAAMALGVSYADLAWVENGYFNHLPGRIMRALTGAGFDADAVQIEYQTWREAQAKGLPCGR